MDQVASLIYVEETTPIQALSSKEGKLSERVNPYIVSTQLLSTIK
jgi:hypothetical protein